MSAASVGNVVTKAGQNAGALEHANQQMGQEASAFDVWTHSYDGMADRMRGFADDPAGALANFGREQDAAVAAGLTGDWHSSSFSAVGDSIAAQADGLGDMVNAIGEAEGALATVGATFALLTGVEQMLSTLVSVIPFPALPAIRIMDMDVGLPHGHMHPPNLVPPAPMVPLPSTGPIIPIPILSGATRTLINGMPAARCGDMGLGIWCGGYFPMYEVFLGSSSVWIEGARAGRLAVDITKHCIFTSPKPQDLPLGPMVGVTIMASGNVLIGGVPMPSLLSLAMGAAMKGLMKGLGKAAKAFDRATRGLRQRLFRNMKPGLFKCRILRAEPVDSRTGEVVVNDRDFWLAGRLVLQWHRHYGSENTRMGACGYGWETPADARLELGDDGAAYFFDGGGTATYFPTWPRVDPVFSPVDGSSLKASRDGWVVQVKGGVTYHFRADLTAGETLIQHIADLAGNQIRFLRDANGLREIAESAGRRIQVVSRNGLVHAMYLIHPHHQDAHVLASFEYDSQGQLIVVRDALGVPFTYAYTDGRLTRHTDREGLSFYYQYDHEGRCESTWGDGGIYAYRFVYGPGTTQVTDSLGYTSTIAFNDRFQILREIDCYGGTTTYEYDVFGRTTAETDPLGNRTEYAYDVRANLVGLTTADGAKTSASFNEYGQPTRVVDPKGNEWRQDWTDNGKLERLVSPIGGVTRYSHTYAGDLIQVESPTGARTSYRVDAFGHVTLAEDATGQRTDFTVDAFGRVVQRRNARGTRSYEHDPRGLLIAGVSIGGGERRWEYDGRGDVVSYTDPMGNITRFIRGGTGQVTARVEPNGERISYRYDSEERLIGVINEHGAECQLLRDGLGRIIERIDYWGGRTLFEYDAGGNIVAKTDQLGRRTRYRCDPLGRVLTKYLPDGTIVRFAYDEVGNRLLTESAAAKAERRFDPENRLVEENLNGFVVEHEYDLGGNVIATRTSHGQVISNVYDVSGRITAIRANKRPVVELRRDATGMVIEETLGDRLHETYRYDNEGRLRQQELRSDRMQILTRSYEYDRVGNLILRDDSRKGQVAYRYDECGRVIAWRRGAEPEVRVDRIFSASAGSVDLGDTARRTRVGGVECDYDAAGNLVYRKEGEREQRFEWTSDNRLVVAEETDGRAVVRMKYDAQGRRLSKAGGDWRVDFYWDQNRLIGEARGADGPTHFIYYPQSLTPVARLDGAGTLTYFVRDNIGLTQELCSAEGDIVWSARYGPTGEDQSLDIEEIENPLRFPGQYADEEIGLRSTRFRYIDPTVNAFISPDPLGLFGGHDLYQYAPNPWTWWDLLGLICKTNIKRLDDLPEGPGIYHIRSRYGNYTGSAVNLRERLLRDTQFGNHATASRVLDDPHATITIREVDLGAVDNAATRRQVARDAGVSGPLTEQRATNHVLRGHEQDVMKQTKTLPDDPDSLNKINAASPNKADQYADEIDGFGSTMDAPWDVD